MATAVKKTNWFAIWTSVAVVVVIAAVAAVVVLSNQAASRTPAKEIPSSVDQTTGAISVGSGEHVVATYADFMCPVCNTFETQYGEQLLTLAENNDITLELHPVSILDRMSQNTEYSTRAANAMYCVADAKPEYAVSYMQALFKNQPAEGSSGLTNDKLTSLAAGMDVDIKACVQDGKFSDFVTKQTQNQMPSDPATGNKGTPTVTIDGEFVSLSTIGQSGTWFTDQFGEGKAPSPEPTTKVAD